MIALTARGVRAVLLDIEGTTTPIAFVHEVLFPYARARLRAFLENDRDPAVAEAVAALAREHERDAASNEPPPPWPGRAPADIDAVVTYAKWLMDRDRKSTGLKLLQGRIWEAGYRTGELQGQVYADVAPAIRRWRTAGLRVAIYSSGSELAQRLLFATTPQGDLTPLISGFFDTTVGSKMSAASYSTIAGQLNVEAGALFFISDVTRELDAARAAGVQVALSIRPGNPPQPAHAFETIHTFDELI